MRVSYGSSKLCLCFAPRSLVSSCISRSTIHGRLQRLWVENNRCTPLQLLHLSGRIVSYQSSLLNHRPMFVMVFLFIVCLAVFPHCFQQSTIMPLMNFSLCGPHTTSLWGFSSNCCSGMYIYTYFSRYFTICGIPCSVKYNNSWHFQNNNYFKITYIFNGTYVVPWTPCETQSWPRHRTDSSEAWSSQRHLVVRQ